MKRTVVMLLCLCLLAMMAGCNVQNITPTAGTTATKPPKAPEAESPWGLEVYYLQETVSTSLNILREFQRHYPHVTVNATAFSSVEEMDQQITDDLLSGEGPDVILFPDTTGIDTTKLALNDVFADLSWMLDNDSTYDSENYYPVLDAGVIGGGQYLMPLRMKFMYMMTSQEKFSENLELREDYTLENLMDALRSNATVCTEAQSAMHTMHSFDTYLYDLLRLTGVELVDMDGLTQVVSLGTIKKYAAFSQMAYNQCLKAAGHMREYGFDNLGELCRRNTAVLSDQSLPGHLRYFAAIYSQGLEEEIRLITYPNQSNADALTVDISLYAAVLKDTGNLQTAYTFVRSAMDNGFTNINEQLPISKKGNVDLLTTLSTSIGKGFFVGSNFVTVQKLSLELEAECEALLDRITGGSIPNAQLETIFLEFMESFIMEGTDFDICYGELEKALADYLDGLYD